MTERLTDWTPDMKILAECDPRFDPERRFEYCGAVRDDGYRLTYEATQEEKKAAKALARNTKHALIHALHSLDQSAGRTVSKFSNLAAVSADREDYLMVRGSSKTATKADLKERAEARHTRRTLEALEELTVPADLWSGLRRRVVRALRAFGIEFKDGYSTSDPDNPCLFCAREIVTLLRSWDTLRHYPQYPEHAQVKADLVRTRMMEDR